MSSSAGLIASTDSFVHYDRRAMSAEAIRPQFIPKIWGSKHLQPWFPNQDEEIGEVWFRAGDLLIKFLFTTENLSVQVHPNDDYARARENSLGKTEMWHILRAERGASVALGFKCLIGRERMGELARSGEIIDQLAWHEARPGDSFFVPAGTVHAIGAGLTLCEVQQNSDITYRIYDYGRPRDLHLEKAQEVAELGIHPGVSKPRALEPGREILVESDYFVTERLVWQGSAMLKAGYCVILEGEGTLDGLPFRPGTVWRILGAASLHTQTSAVALYAKPRTPAR